MAVGVAGMGSNQRSVVLRGKAVEAMDLSRKRLTEVPAEVWQLVGLNTLDLRGNEALGSLPAEIGQLTALQTLRPGRGRC